MSLWSGQVASWSRQVNHSIHAHAFILKFLKSRPGAIAKFEEKKHTFPHVPDMLALLMKKPTFWIWGVTL